MPERISRGLVPLAALFWFAHLMAALGYPLGNDPAIFQYHAWAMGVGEIPYVDALDVNSPGIIVLHWAWGALMGFSDVAFLSLALLLSTLALGGAVYELDRRALHAGAMALGLCVAMWAFVGITPWDRGQREIFQGILLLAALWAAANDRFGAAGLCVGAAITIKASILLVIAPTGAAWLIFHRPTRRHVISLVAGAAAPVVAALLWLYSIGAWDAFWWTQLHYLPHHRAQFTAPWTDAMSQPLPLVVLAAGVSALAVAKVRVIGVALLSGVALYLFQQHGWIYHLHWTIPLLLPVVALLVEPLAKRLPRATIGTTTVLLVLIGMQVHFDLGDGLKRAHSNGSHWDFDAHQAVAAYLQKNSAAGDRVLTNNDEHQLLYMARRRSATRCLYSALCSESHSGDPFKRLSEERLETLSSRPPQWVVWNTTPQLAALDSMAANPRLSHWIKANCRAESDIGPYRLWRCADSVYNGGQ